MGIKEAIEKEAIEDSDSTISDGDVSRDSFVSIDQNVSDTEILALLLKKQQFCQVNVNINYQLIYRIFIYNVQLTKRNLLLLKMQ